MFNSALKRAARPLWARLKRRIDAAVKERLDALGYTQPWEPPRLFVPPCPPYWEVSGPFMAYSTCSSADLMHPEYARICTMIQHAAVYHRKSWEWVFVVHHLVNAGVLREGSRGIGFGVGREHLPAFFAAQGAEVLATDAPASIGQRAGWIGTGEYSESLESLYFPNLVPREVFERKVHYRECDMNAIPQDLAGFDFTWSCCCFEHLGSLEAGMQFVIDSVEKTLRVGGIACHTTEFNLSSNDATVTSGHTVLYRKRDIEELVHRLRDRGHDVQPFRVAPDSHYLDGFVDAPPYSHTPHIKLLLEGFVTTSVGLVVRRGR